MISHAKPIVIIGLLIVVVPLLGLPHGWEAGLVVIAGLSVVALASLQLLTEALEERAHKRRDSRRQDTESED